ncbi:MAG: FAD-dependent oxidoreductase, partial [Mesorhizobium sp.]
ELSIKCDFAERPSLLLAGDVLDASGLEEEVALRREAGIYADYLKRSDLKARFGIARAAAILNPDNIAIDPRKLTAGLLNQAFSRGAKIHAPVEATGFESSKSGVTVSTRDGPTIRASHVVLATGYELASIAPHKGHSIVSTWALATKPQPGLIWPRQAFIWEASDPYLYLRATPDGRVICGGEDEEFEDEDKRDAMTEQKTRRIAVKLKKLMPQLDVTPEYAWAGSFGTTPTGLPIIGKVPRHTNIQSIMGYGGNGITFSRIAAELVTSAILGKKDCDAELFAPKG